MTALRVTLRILLITLHLLLGLVLTPLALSRHTGGLWRTHPRITSWWHNRLADILGLTVTVAGHRPAPPALLASNHVSWLDVIVLGGLTHTDFLSKDEVRRWPLVGWLAARSGTLFIRRGNGETSTVSAQIAARLRADGLLTLFPEGTTTDGRQVGPFYSRLFAAALDTGTDVVPVALRYHVDGGFDATAPYTDDQSLYENLRGLILRERSAVHVVFGEPISLSNHTRREVAELARNAIVEALGRPIRPPLPAAEPVLA
ncbi:MAG: 1-acyl-sn-glycerol-3-phosphate acyltransferase [Chromatiaceae bacterium]|nr:1-acyl-sn-glycerol-3-phosphate acyltransferase [Gammaproteobacteria bacterium]MCP5299969.1 1-acyl-sn-glycerol-3-phosphate acyltransferase [Chromatiaceae bacterium]MCP5422041.1 1-acyl-sn-glycerol-3-phosphate acyltransferase [Chromatiaceae bacterium]